MIAKASYFYATLFLLLFITAISITASAGPPGWMKPGASYGADLSEAKSDYMLNCAMCHGEEGDGKGQLADSLSAPPRNHTDAKYMSQKTDAQLFKAISEGGAAVGKAEDMPPHKTILQKKNIEGLVKYLRHLCKCKYEKK